MESLKKLNNQLKDAKDVQDLKTASEVILNLSQSLNLLSQRSMNIKEQESFDSTRAGMVMSVAALLSLTGLLEPDGELHKLPACN